MKWYTHWRWVQRCAAWFGITFTLAVVLWGVPHTAAAQEAPPDLPTYTASVREAFTAAQRGDRLSLEDVAQRLVGTREVQLADGSRASVDNRWLADALAQSNPDLPLVGERLGALLDALALPQSAAPADARARLEAILNNPPFAEREPSTPQWLQDFLRWLGRLIDQLLSSVAPGAGASINTGATVVAIIGGVLLLAVVAYLLLGLRRTMSTEARADDVDPEANLTARTALDQASDLARGGDYRTAVRYLYLSALLWLDERDKLRYDRALTNREYLERVSSNPALRAQLAPIVETFDRVWYGHAELDADTFAAYRAQVEALRKDVSP